MNYRERIMKLSEQPETAAAGKSWTLEEENQLIDSLSTGKEISDIANEHKRTMGGIKSRIRVIAFRMVETDGLTMEEVSAKLRLTPEEIKDALQRRRSRIAQPKTKPDTDIDILKDIRDILIRIEAKLAAN